MNVPDAEIVAGSIAWLKVAATFWLMGTAMAALAGSVESTMGAIALAAVPVVKLQT